MAGVPSGGPIFWCEERSVAHFKHFTQRLSHRNAATGAPPQVTSGSLAKWTGYFWRLIGSGMNDLILPVA